MAIPLMLGMVLASRAFAADVVLNEYNAVPGAGGFLAPGKSDSRLGYREGNGGDWFEWVVITDHLDMRGWEIVISNRTGEPAIPGPGEEIFNLVLTADPVWADLRSGTIVTVSEDVASAVNDYRPAIGNWWINVKASNGASGKYITPINFAVSNSNTQITIKDSLGAVVYGPSGEGIQPLSGVGSTEVFKLEATPSAATTPASIAYAAGGSSSFGLPNAWTDPGGPAIQDLSALRSVVPYSPLTSVVINEVNTHSDPPEQDWIELLNRTGAPIDIGGWFLSDGSTNLMQFSIPPATTIPANGYLVFLESELPFSLNAELGEAVYLSEGDGAGAMTGGRDFIEFGPVENGVSYGRFPNAVGPFYRMATRTQAATNAVPDFGPLAINEVMYNALGPAPTPLTGGDLEFVEIRNDSSVDMPLAVDYGVQGLYPWRLSGALDFDFPTNAVVPANGFVLVVNFDPVLEAAKVPVFRSHYGLPASTPILGPNGGRLSNYSDTVNLRRPDVPDVLGVAPMVLRDTITYFDFDAWPTAADGAGSSLERIDATNASSGPTDWAASLTLGGTPDAENSTSGLGVPAMPSLGLAALGLGIALAGRRRLALTRDAEMDQDVRSNV